MSAPKPCGGRLLDRQNLRTFYHCRIGNGQSSGVVEHCPGGVAAERLRLIGHTYTAITCTNACTFNCRFVDNNLRRSVAWQAGIWVVETL